MREVLCVLTCVPRQMRRIIELNQLDPTMYVPSTGHWALCSAAECGQVEAVRYLVNEVRCAPAGARGMRGCDEPAV